MDREVTLRKRKRSGTYLRKVHQANFQAPNGISELNFKNISSDDYKNENLTFEEFDTDFLRMDITEQDDDDKTKNEYVNSKENFATFLKNWAIEFNIPHVALEPLMRKINGEYNSRLPIDPRTLMGTPQENVDIKIISGGSYWHQGFEFCVRKCFFNLKKPLSIKINVNINGLPLFEDGSDQFWPILFNVYEMPHIQPMIIGLFYGKSEPQNIEEFLIPFIDEAIPILNSGLVINGNNLKIGIRAIICNSPAQAFIKGVVNFNNQHGCLKCCTVGFHSRTTGCTIFPQIKCVKRTDAGFRARDYHKHYQSSGEDVSVFTPLLQLPIDIVKDVIIADSLHLLHLGVIKRILIAYKNGKVGMTVSKWTDATVTEISTILTGIKVPVEFHSAVRGINDLTHWKASECSVFLNYLGIVVLKSFLATSHYKNFLNLFCAVTICSTDYYGRFLTKAQKLFETFIKTHYRLFRSVTMSIHNLQHIVDEVRRFGALPSLSSYPFENHLYKIKQMLRSGHFPLCQIANRLSEITVNQINNETDPLDIYPLFKSPLKSDISKYTSVQLRKDFLLKQNAENKWFMNKNGDIIAMEYAKSNGIFGLKLKERTDFFDYPWPSSKLLIFQTDNPQFCQLDTFSFDNVLCKLVAIVTFGKTVFIPLHHTFPVNERL